jgi:hypothetical protein
MDKSSGPSRESGGRGVNFCAQPPDLDLPDAPEFESKPPRLPWLVIFKRSEERLPFKTRQAGFEQRRLETKSSEEFVL